MLANRDLLSRDFASALNHGRVMLEITEKTEAPVPIILALVGMAHALFEMGKTRQAIALLNRAKADAAQMPCFQWTVLFLFLEARMAFVREGPEEVRSSLSHLLGEMKARGYVYFLYFRPDVMADLCAKALEEGVEAEFAAELIKRRGLLPPPSAVELEAWPHPVKIYTLGGFFHCLSEQAPGHWGQVPSKKRRVFKGGSCPGGQRRTLFPLGRRLVARFRGGCGPPDI